MDILALLEALRTNYLQEFEAAYHRQVEVNEQVFPEIAFETSEGPYKRLFVLDFVGRNGESKAAIEVEATNDAYGGDISLQYKGLTIQFGWIAWDAMRFTLQPIPEDLIGFEEWFDKWIDLEGTRHVEGQLFSNVIHSSRLDVGVVEVDFGSAPTDAFTELFDIFEVSGVNSVVVSSGRD